jgi:para-nitrobenzyl esterase
VCRTLLCLAVFASLGSSVSVATPVRIDSGLLEGMQENGVLVFKGVPFAAPPIGPLRWRAPQAPAAWPGIRSANQFAPICMQHGSYPEDAPPERMSEDCLYLNIWVPPHASGGPLPVMVWIYGGGLMNGSASTPLYAGDMLANKGVIVVTANYRLGVLGFLAHPDLSRESPQHVSGNYGLLDQLAALRWVHRNIGAFGGDPARVTVFGQSSGSISISALTTSPLAKGLFQRAIGESGGLFEPVDLAPGFKLVDAEQDGRAFVAKSGARSLEDLRAMPAEDVIKTRFNPHLIIDGYALSRAPYDAYREGQQNDVDLLIGSNAREGQLFLADQTITAANLHKVLDNDFSHPIVSLIGPGSVADDEQAKCGLAGTCGHGRACKQTQANAWSISTGLHRARPTGLATSTLAGAPAMAWRCPTHLTILISKDCRGRRRIVGLHRPCRRTGQTSRNPVIPTGLDCLPGQHSPRRIRKRCCWAKPLHQGRFRM